MSISDVPADRPVPRRVRLVHSQVGGNHVFTSPDLDDLQVADADLSVAYSRVAGDVADVVSRLWNVRHHYVLNLTYEELTRGLYSPTRDFDDRLEFFAAVESHANISDPHADFVPEAQRRREARLKAS